MNDRDWEAAITLNAVYKSPFCLRIAGDKRCANAESIRKC